MKKQKKSIKIYLFLGMIFLLALYLMFNSDGFFQYWSVKNEIKEIDKEIVEIDQKMESLKKEIDSLKNDPVKIENLARKKYHMKGKNEKLIKMNEK